MADHHFSNTVLAIQKKSINNPTYCDIPDPIQMWPYHTFRAPNGTFVNELVSFHELFRWFCSWAEQKNRSIAGGCSSHVNDDTGGYWKLRIVPWYNEWYNESTNIDITWWLTTHVHRGLFGLVNYPVIYMGFLERINPLKKLGSSLTHKHDERGTSHHVPIKNDGFSIDFHGFFDVYQNL